MPTGKLFWSGSRRISGRTRTSTRDAHDLSTSKASRLTHGVSRPEVVFVKLCKSGQGVKSRCLPQLILSCLA